MKDADIDYSDIPPLDKSFFTKWLKTHCRGYQTRINRILRAAMESQPPRRSRSAPALKKSTRSRGGLKPV